MSKTESLTVMLSPEQRAFVKRVAEREAISEGAVVRGLVAKAARRATPVSQIHVTQEQ